LTTPFTVNARACLGARAAAALVAIICAWGTASMPPGAAAADTGMVAVTPTARVEAREAGLLAVGIAQDDRMVVHLSRLVDNAPVRNAVLTVLLRGVVHPTMAEADGSYTLQTKDLALPGPAAVVFQVAVGGVREDIKGVLDIPGTPDKPEDKNGARQLWWWLLNFAVCTGFLMLWSRRRKAAAAADE
jgi:hypothetical protein